MDRELFDRVDKLSDMVNEKFVDLYNRGEFRHLEVEMSKACIGRKKKSVSARMEVIIFDEEKEQSIVCHKVGLTANAEGKPYIYDGVSSPESYLIDGEITTIPKNYCPRCWGPWDFKYKNGQCGTCGAVIGKDFKIMLDSNECPHCLKGTVSFSEPLCCQCGHRVDLDKVTWG